MLERKEFGKRGQVETAPQKDEPRNFDRERPMYERLRHTDERIDALLTRHDEIHAFQMSGQGTSEDAKVMEKIEKDIATRFRERNS
jgi:hypothetical protein